MINRIVYITTSESIHSFSPEVLADNKTVYEDLSFPNTLEATNFEMSAITYLKFAMTGEPSMLSNNYKKDLALQKESILELIHNSKYVILNIEEEGCSEIICETLTNWLENYNITVIYVASEMDLAS